MRVRILAGMVLLAAQAWGQGTCRREAIEGQVKAGEGFSRKIGGGLAVMLEPLASGWIVRVIPANGMRGDHDYAELATPPYESVNPLLVTTDFAFRAQDAVGWNPRRFRFASSVAAFEGLRDDYRKLRGTGAHGFGQPFSAPGLSAAERQRVEADLAHRVSGAAEGELEIMDAGLVGGTANQGPNAALVSSHFNRTAHIEEKQADGGTTPLGKIDWLRFRITLMLPQGFGADGGAKTVAAVCS